MEVGQRFGNRRNRTTTMNIDLKRKKKSIMKGAFADYLIELVIQSAALWHFLSFRLRMLHGIREMLENIVLHMILSTICLI